MSLDGDEPTAADPAPAGANRHVGLILVLVVLMAAIALDRVAGGLWIPYVRQHLTIWGYAQFYAEQSVAYLLAGLVIDTFGVKRVVGLALIGWWGLIMLSGLAGSPSDLGGIHLVVVLVFGVIHVAPHAAVKRGTRSGNSALALAIPLLASYIWLAGIPDFRTFLSESGPFGAGFATRWMWYALVCATGASFIAMVWLVLYRGRETPGGRSYRNAFDQVPILLADRRVWALLLLWSLTSISIAVGEHRLFRFLSEQRDVKESTVGAAIYYPYLAAIAGALVAAGWSDRIYRQTGSLVSARRPFAVAAFALSAALGLVPLVRQNDLIAMSSIAAVGIGMQLIVDVIVIDVAPARYVGTLVGLLAALDDAVRFAFGQLALVAYEPAHSFVPILVVGGIVGIAGAFAAYRLLQHIEPIRDPAADRDIPGIFT